MQDRLIETLTLKGSHSSKCAIAKFALSLKVFEDITVLGSIIEDDISHSQSLLPKWAKQVSDFTHLNHNRRERQTPTTYTAQDILEVLKFTKNKVITPKNANMPLW